ncbi:MAG: hypothetical protein ACAI35_09000 [Candidatus Methylacidiphilales bacterium]|nr:hypothetical protein [Candidatus Methylacidiphilales bacterium]
MSIWNFSARRCNFVVFHHIPKCGGVSLVATFSRWFSIVGDYEDSFRSPHTRDPLDTFHKLSVPLAALNPASLLCGHFNVPGAFLHQRYPALLQSRDRFLFTYVRDPLEVATSLYYYKHSRNEIHGQTLLQFLRDQSNYIAHQMPCTASNYQDVLARYDFIGQLEHVHDHTVALLKLMSCRLFEDESVMARRVQFLIDTRPVDFSQRYNEVPRDDQLKRLTESDLVEFHANNTLDYKIYDHVTRLRQADSKRNDEPKSRHHSPILAFLGLL